MKKLSALTQYLIALNLVSSEKIESWAEDARLISRHDEGENGKRILFERGYTAQILIEGWPNRIPPDLLFAHVVIWLMEHDPDRENTGDKTYPAEGDPQIDVDILNNDEADVSIAIHFKEPVEIIKDDSGTIPYLGDLWRLVDPNE